MAGLHSPVRDDLHVVVIRRRGGSHDLVQLRPVTTETLVNYVHPVLASR